MINSIKDYAVLNNGVKMPWLGMGIFTVKDDDEMMQVVRWSVEAGYRSFDTATAYENESQFGKAVKACGVPREELFITTKVWNAYHGYDSTLKAFEESRKKLDMDYVDLYLIHWPVKGKYMETWRALETIYKNGWARSIGVSNFQIHHLQDVFAASDIVPVVNQVEYHPLFSQQPLRSFCREHKIQMEAYCPLMNGGDRINNPILVEIGKKYGKTPAQVILRWDLQNEVITIPKSSNPKRIIENASIFDFELSSEDMGAIDRMTQPNRLFSDPDNFNF